jgi:uncharacterized membrane protein
MTYSPPPGTTTTTATVVEPSRPLGVAILAVLIGIFAVIVIVGGLLVLLASSFAFVPFPLFGTVGVVAGILLFIFGLILLGVAVGLWHQRLWALVLTIIVLILLIIGNVLSRTFTLGFFIEIILLIYLLAVHRHFL